MEEEHCTCEEGCYEEHPCPYHQEVNDDEIMCTCCPYCEDQCADDV